MTFGVYWSRWSHQDLIMLRSEYGRCRGDDRIIANGGRQDKLTEASHKASHGGSLWQQVKRKTTEGDEDNQWTNLIGGRSCNRSRIQTIKCQTLCFQHYGCNSGCRSRRFQCLMQVLYRLINEIDKDHGQYYDRLVMTRWVYCRHWWIYQFWRSSIAGQ